MAAWITVHAVPSVFAGLGFGFAVSKLEWLRTGQALVASMILIAVALYRPDIAQTRLLRYRYGRHRGMASRYCSDALVGKYVGESIDMERSPRS
jgi:hypothetical protein